MQTLKTTHDGTQIGFDAGRFDNWCVYIKHSDEPRFAPTDSDYFTVLKNFADAHGNKVVMNIFIDIYKDTTPDVDPEILTKITFYSSRFEGDSEVDFDVAMTCVYLGMVAEENKANTKLGKRIKCLAVHQIFVEGEPIEKVVEFSKGMDWREIHQECLARGIPDHINQN